MVTAGDHYLDGVAYSLACRFRHAVELAGRVGINVRITSGFRPYSEQKRLYDRWTECERLRAGNILERAKAAATCRNVYPAAAPGSSMHERGWALDAVPECTPEFAAWYLPRYRSGASFDLPSSGLGAPQLSTDPALTCDRVPAYALMGSGTGITGIWDLILKESGLVRPYPQSDPVHIEPCELPSWRAQNAL